MEGGFVRPASVPKGVWGRYSTFRIEDIPVNKREDAIQHMKDHFFKDEPTTTVIKKISPFTDEDIHAFLRNALNDNVSLYAVDEANNEEIIGAYLMAGGKDRAPAHDCVHPASLEVALYPRLYIQSCCVECVNAAGDENQDNTKLIPLFSTEKAGVTILRVASRHAPNRHEKVDTSLKSMQLLFDFLEYCHQGVDTFTYESSSSKVVVDHVLEPMGLSVSPQYRGKGIGQALIRARHKLAAHSGIRATQGIYTSIYSQNIILRQGMQLIKEVPYADYFVDGKAIFAELNPPHPSAKVIGGLFTNDVL